MVERIHGDDGCANVGPCAIPLAATTTPTAPPRRRRLHALFGGFHLNGPAFEPIIGPTITALTELAPDVVVPAHCTGWKAQHRLAAALPDAFIPNAVGTSFHLTAA